MVNADPPRASGYQQAILYLIGSSVGDRFSVRCTDRWYVDQVAELFPTRPYLQRRADGKSDFWTIKSPAVVPSRLSDVTDMPGFCRGVIELQGTLDLWRHRSRRSGLIRTLRLRIYGTQELLSFVMPTLPAGEKKIQSVRTGSGSTCAIYFQSPREVADILSYISGDPRNKALWDHWTQLLRLSSHEETE